MRNLLNSVTFDGIASQLNLDMDRFHLLLLDFWREACRHIEIGESSETFLRLLRSHMPLEGLIFYRLEQEHQQVVVAAAVPEKFGGRLATSETFRDRPFRQLVQWVRQGEIAQVDPSDRPTNPLAALTSLPETGRSLLVVPLQAPQGTLGAITLTPDAGAKFSGIHEDLLRTLQEPLAVALENDRRLHELNLLRSAAEADRRSLLQRLGRERLADTVVGSETGLRQVMERVRQISPSDLPALILGETGTGKELVARAIHNGSARKDGPFIRVNCGAIPAELIDSHLFGHEKGSFTGAVESRQGWFERADGGTLFLDEIGELPPKAQVRFLRVLQDGFVERVGGNRSIHVNVRVVAATHRDLAAMVQASTFREDLWYRIAVFPILIPPLRERKEDIPQLVEHFVQKAAARFGLPPVAATDEDLRLLCDYDWPGNIRELGAVIDRAAILGEGRSLAIAASLGVAQPRPVPATVRPSESLPLPSFPSPSTGLPLSSRPPEILSLNDAARRQIEAALEATRGRIEGPHGAAAVLKINPHTLRARMRKLGIDWTEFRSPLPRR